MNTILVIDDDDPLRKSFEKLLTEEGYLVHSAASGEAGIQAVKNRSPDLVILDLRLPGMNGMAVFGHLHQTDPKLPVIIMTAYGSTDTAIKTTQMGAFDYILKPFDIPNMLSTIRQALNAGRFMRSPVHLDGLPDKADRDAMIGKSPAMQEVYKAIGRVAATDATVLIRGESGTGKELAARAIYQHSRRAERPFLVINCVAIPDTLLESELFGYEKGAFTGATHRRIGKIEQAGGGTIFLDEIGDMPINLQAKILRLLQERCIERLGGRETVAVDVRIVAATNRDLERMISEGRFREDLYYRLKVVTIWLPPLSQRIEDIRDLAHYHLSKHAAELGLEAPAITREALADLEKMPWPGNVRELSNTLQKALIFNRGVALSRDDILNAAKDEYCRPAGTASQDYEAGLRRWIREELQNRRNGQIFESLIDRFAALLIEEALNHTGGNRSQAAKLLGITRPTLHAKIDKYRLMFQTSVKQAR
ncbi:MAG: sigma-54-dependent Fis family transcriptional regulator [Desulfatitalea sp.]|nr:sigma-54 dependent transcriptional regulator [Desulfatitalea sp.]NNK00069.1 sigma-54-dependent Fis family transcriptional regulator [Desulfatitalea sp.]